MLIKTPPELSVGVFLIEHIRKLMMLVCSGGALYMIIRS